MALSAEADITQLNHTLQQLITQLALYKLGNPRESTQNTELLTLITVTEQYKTLIAGKEQHKNTAYRTREIFGGGNIGEYSESVEIHQIFTFQMS